MLSKEQKAYFADVATRDADLVSLIVEGRDVLIPSADCEPGYLYWGGGRSIGELAVCQERGIDKSLPDAVLFQGLRNKSGIDFLFSEVHYDDDSRNGTWCPLLKLEEAPKQVDKDVLMQWLLDQTIDLVETRIHWLRSMPNRLKQAPSYGGMLDDATQHLDRLRTTKDQGFSDTPAPTFRQIIEARRAEILRNQKSSN
jgi:hypothetical protein